MRRSRLPTPKLVVSLVFEELDLNLLHHVRNLVAGFIKAPPRRISAELVSRVTLSLHELLENAVKHSRGKRAVFELRMDALDKRRLLLRTSNPATAANAKQVKALLRRLSRTTPQALYQELLLETSTREVGSGLGLVRIAAECGMVLSSSFDGKSLVMEAWNQPDPHEATHVSDSRG